ncbi:sigma-70 family RNA polymerase sigma factor [bacterium]|nr:sigma-70 family RNA polymerase sigma factor [bacterium]
MTGDTEEPRDGMDAAGVSAIRRDLQMPLPLWAMALDTNDAEASEWESGARGVEAPTQRLIRALADDPHLPAKLLLKRQAVWDTVVEGLSALVTPPEAPAGEDLANDTAELLRRYRDGDRRAVDEIYERLLPELERWAHGRLPKYARDHGETQDLVQETAMSVLDKLDRFDSKGRGALLGYMKSALRRRVIDYIRKAGRTPTLVEIEPEDRPIDAPQDGIQLVGELVEIYIQAFSKLPDDDQQAIMASMQHGKDHAANASSLGKPSPAAARMAIKRAKEKLAALAAEVEQEGLRRASQASERTPTEATEQPLAESFERTFEAMSVEDVVDLGGPNDAVPRKHVVLIHRLIDRLRNERLLAVYSQAENQPDVERSFAGALLSEFARLKRS